MSTVFRRTDGKYVFLPNNILNTKLIENVRRSGPTSESFSFDVAFDTNFEQIQALRERMLRFLANNKVRSVGSSRSPASHVLTRPGLLSCSATTSAPLTSTLSTSRSSPR